MAASLATVHHRQGRLLGRMEALGFPLQQEAVLQTVTLDVVKSSEIEGEVLNPEQVRSSFALRLGMDVAGVIPSDRHVEGVVLNKILDGFEGKLTSSKWAKLTRCSQDTASRDIQDLIGQGMLVKDPAGGRSTSYSLRERYLR